MAQDYVGEKNSGEKIESWTLGMRRSAMLNSCHATDQ
jgi:hypothetical protein